MKRTKKETLLQNFEWYLVDDGSYWRSVSKQAPSLAQLGITKVWLPPAYKGHNGKYDVGYGVYDLYDLGEFNQKDTVRTRYGTKEEYLQAIKALQESGIEVLGDIVFNHIMGGDEQESVLVEEVDEEDRTKAITKPYWRDIYTKFTFKGRNKKYSDFEWCAKYYNGCDVMNEDGCGIVRFVGKDWSPLVSKEQGNFDYTMGYNIDVSVPEVVEELNRWGRWYLDTTGIDGFRIDSAKSIDAEFFNRWLKAMEEHDGKEHFCVGEYWSGDIEDLKTYFNQSHFAMKLFDVPLHFKLVDAAKYRHEYDFHQIFNETLTGDYPDFAVPFVDNHDTQPDQSLESWVPEDFKLRAYALLLLRDIAYPTVFYGDLYGISHSHIPPVKHLEELIWIRTHFLGDELIDLNDDDHSKMAWYVEGEHPVFVVLSGNDAKKATFHNPKYAGATLVDLVHPQSTVAVDSEGNGELFCPADDIAVYLLIDDYKVIAERQ